MKYLHLIYRKDSAQRPVNWRWMLAAHVLDTASGRVPKSHRDQELYKAIVFQRALRSCELDKDRLMLLDTAPDYFEAWTLYGNDAEQNLKWEIEARLLARESFETIARKVATSEDVVRAYESWFFNVADRLESPGYITHQVFGRSVHFGLTARNYDCLWKMYGYWGGPVVLDSMIYQFNQPTTAGNTGGVSAFLDEDLSLILRLKACTAARTMPVSWETQLEILNIYTRMLEIERNSDAAGSGGASSTILANLEAFVSRLPWHKSDEKPKLENSAVQRLRASGVCLRSNELLLASTEGLPERTVEILATAQFPDKEIANAPDSA